MPRPLALTLALLGALLAEGAVAEIYRCDDPGGGVRFVDDPASCGQAERYEPRGRIQASATPPPAAAGATPPPGDARALAALLPDESEVGLDWEITREAAVSEMDPDQRSWGVLETQARHYGRVQAGVTEVCSIELWRLASAAQATAAAQGISRPGWSFEARGTLLVTLRGTRFERGQPFRQGLFPDCVALGSRVGSPR